MDENELLDRTEKQMLFRAQLRELEAFMGCRPIADCCLKFYWSRRKREVREYLWQALYGHSLPWGDTYYEVIDKAHKMMRGKAS